MVQSNDNAAAEVVALKDVESGAAVSGQSTKNLLGKDDASSSFSTPNPLVSNRSYIPKDADALGKNQRLMLKWENLTYKVDVTLNKQKTEKTILSQLSGAALPGEVLAIMGPSGGGKTSLLNVLAGRVKAQEGTVTLNNRKLPKKFNKLSAYVMQDDLLFGTMTPREIITFAANLRLHHLPSEERKQRVEYLITILSLKSCADTLVGRPMARGISGGERKRTAIGYEMVTNPSLIFLDEPTTGLDSYTALSVVRSLQKLAVLGRTVICTIHQPSSEIFALFDKLILLSSGKTAYSGPSRKAVEYFASIGYTCPTYSNPSDYYMKILKTRDETDQQRVDKITEDWKVRGKEIVSDLTNGESVVSEGADQMIEEVEKPVKSAPWYKEVRLLTMRSVIDTYRNPITFYARLIQFVVVGLFMGATYIPLGNNQTSVQNAIGVLYFFSIGYVMLNANGVILTFPLERGLLIRDQYSGMYRVWTYFLGKMISELPFGIIIALAASLVPYWFVGLANTAAQFFTFVLIVWVQMYSGGSIGLLLGCAMPNPELAVSISPVFIIPFMLFGGFYTNLSSIGPWLNWVQWISPFKWGFEAFGLNQFTGWELMCTDSQYLNVHGTLVCPITKGEQIISFLSFTSSTVWEPIFILLGIALFLRVLALIFLEWQTRRALKRT